MANYKKTVLPFLFVIIQIFGSFYPVVFILMAADIVSIKWHGYGVDSEGYVYIGRQSEICVYADEDCVRTIDIPQYRSYYFTIDNNDIILASSSRVYTLDLNGNVLSEEFDPGSSVYSNLQWIRNVRTSNGELYSATHLFLRNAVVKEDGTIVYQMPIEDFLAKICFYLGGVCFIIFGGKTLIERKKQ